MFILVFACFALRDVWSTSAVPPGLARSAFPRDPSSIQVSPYDDLFGVNHRSTWEIVRDCLLTIFACTWISVHPNVRGYRSTFWGITIQRAKLFFWALMVPELVLGWAIRQHFGAKAIETLLLGEIGKLAPLCANHPPSSRKSRKVETANTPANSSSG